MSAPFGMGCQCPFCLVTPHDSCCAVHSAPAMPVGPCNCSASEPVYLVFDHIPGPDGARFIEAETADGKSVNAATWSLRPDSLAQLGPLYRVADLAPSSDAGLAGALQDAIVRGTGMVRVSHIPYAEHAQPPVVEAPSDLQSIEQYRMQMAGISTAAIGYWKEGDPIHPDNDTVALRDVAKLYAEYAALSAAQPANNNEKLQRYWYQRGYDCGYENGTAEMPAQGTQAVPDDEYKPRKLVGYGDCNCILSQYCDGKCRPIFEDAAAPKPEQAVPDGQAYGIVDPDYARVYTQARIVAWQYGYACVMHGSFTRDLDLLLVPWEEKAQDNHEQLLKLIAQGSGLRFRDGVEEIHKAKVDFTEKPHGRKSCSLYFPTVGDRRWVDISVLATAPKPPAVREGEPT